MISSMYVNQFMVSQFETPRKTHTVGKQPYECYDFDKSFLQDSHFRKTL